MFRQTKMHRGTAFKYMSEYYTVFHIPSSHSRYARELSTRNTLSYKLRHARPQWNRKQQPKKRGGIKNAPILNHFSTTGLGRRQTLTTYSLPPDGSAMYAHRHHHLHRLFKNWRPTEQMPLRSRKTWPQRPPNSVMLKDEILLLPKSYRQRKAKERSYIRSQPTKIHVIVSVMKSTKRNREKPPTILRSEV